eukprot:TRINITY_DN13516_c0_g1_i2.p3 TRINITY_DN13516_c0_g1~~TRINITY_DN13516_c0_g1_i2.p3  ORF type:complete len:113 (+),score=39.26 TRINITY_DN13516_c0_g1_i2:154-492(+)
MEAAGLRSELTRKAQDALDLRAAHAAAQAALSERDAALEAQAAQTADALRRAEESASASRLLAEREADGLLDCLDAVAEKSRAALEQLGQEQLAMAAELRRECDELGRVAAP